QRLTALNNETVGRVARGDGLDLRDFETLGHICSRRSQCVHAKRKWWLLVVERDPGRCRVCAEPIDPSLDEPSRMRAGNCQVLDQRVARGLVWGLRQPGQVRLVARSRELSQHGVGEAGGALFSYL